MVYIQYSTVYNWIQYNIKWFIFIVQYTIGYNGIVHATWFIFNIVHTIQHKMVYIQYSTVYNWIQYNIKWFIFNIVQYTIGYYAQ